LPVYKQPKSPFWLIEFRVAGSRFRNATATMMQVLLMCERSFTTTDVPDMHGEIVIALRRFSETDERLSMLLPPLIGCPDAA
jgi:hypothetical protein